MNRVANQALEVIHRNSKRIKKENGPEAFSIHRSELKHADKRDKKIGTFTGVRRGSPGRSSALNKKIK